MRTLIVFLEQTKPIDRHIPWLHLIVIWRECIICVLWGLLCDYLNVLSLGRQPGSGLITDASLPAASHVSRISGWPALALSCIVSGALVFISGSGPEPQISYRLGSGASASELFLGV